MQQLARKAGAAGSSSIGIELASLQAATDSLARVKQAPDASVALATLLKAWPASVASKPQSIAVNEAGITVSVTVEGDGGPFLRAFSAPAGWAMGEPRLNSADNLTRVVIELRCSPALSAGGDAR